MRKLNAMAFVLLAVVTVVQPSRVAASSPSAAATMWEYKVLTKEQVIDLGKKDLAAGLNKLGSEGWELAGIDSAYIFKRPMQPSKDLADIKRQLAAAEANLGMQKERVSWSERMVKKGYITQLQVQAETLRLNDAQSNFEKLKKELETVSKKSKPAPEPNPKPEK